MFDSGGCETLRRGGSLSRTLLLGLALAAVASLAGAFGFTSTVLSSDAAVASAPAAVTASFCPCGGGGPCCGFCSPAQRAR